MKRSSCQQFVSIAAALGAFLVSGGARAEPGWGDLPGVMLLALVAIALDKAHRYIWWLLGLSILAWAFHLFIGSSMGLTRSSPGPAPRRRLDGRTATFADLRWLLPISHLALTGMTVCALIMILIGKIIGYQYVPRPPLVQPASAAPNRQHALGKPTVVPAPPQNPWSAEAQAIADASWQKHAPNGKPWPVRAGYIAGTGPGSKEDKGQITVSNRSARSPVYLKLCHAVEIRCSGVRQLFLMPGTQMTLHFIPPGDYELRYLDLASERPARSRWITIEPGSKDTPSLTIDDSDAKGDFRSMSLAEF